MIIEEIDYTIYARLLVESGINLQKGENLWIQCSPEGILLARECAKVAYDMGAIIVRTMVRDSHVTRSRVDAQTGDESALSTQVGWNQAMQNSMINENWTFLSIDSSETPGLMAQCNQHSLKIMEKSSSESMKDFRDAITSHKVPWSIGAVPGPVWAKDVLGKDATTRDLWDTLVPILKLDKPDPVAAWNDAVGMLEKRSGILNSYAFDHLHFRAEGTDLTVGLTPQATWEGGWAESRNRKTLPNIPTEEVFTTPDFRRINGKVKVTRTVDVRGTQVKGAQFTFENGAVKSFDAEEGVKTLESYIDTDEGSGKMGEIALVGEDSPLAVSGLLFNSILYDENASCHFALGSAYTDCLTNGKELKNDEDKIRAGCNVSLVHTDFMFGSPSLSVQGITRDGKTVDIMDRGRFLIDS